MSYTESEIAAFATEFTTKRRRQRFAIAPIVASGILIMFADMQTSIESCTALIAGSVALVGGGLWFTFQNWSCPACGRYLGRSLSPRFCIQCGVPLVDAGPEGQSNPALKGASPSTPRIG